MKKNESLAVRAPYWIALLAILSFLALAFDRDLLGIKEFATAALATFGTYFGALFAFRLNESKEEHKEKTDRIAAVNRALFVVARQRLAIAWIQSELRKHSNDFEKAFNFPALRPPTYADLVIDYGSLDFILTGAHANVLMRLSKEQEGFGQVLESLKYRNDNYVDEVMPLIEKGGVNRTELSGADLRKVLGERVYSVAVNSIKITGENLVSSSNGLASSFNDLRAAASELYPKAQFLKLEIKDLQTDSGEAK